MNEIDSYDEHRFFFTWTQDATAAEIEEGMADLRAKVRKVDQSAFEFVPVYGVQDCYRPRQIDIEGAPALQIEAFDPLRNRMIHRINVIARRKKAAA